MWWLSFRKGALRYQHSLLLTTIGARTGVLRTVTLPFWAVDDRVGVCGSNAGAAKDPHWVGNIRADSRCWVDLRRRRVPALARVSEGEEREVLFDRIGPSHPHLHRYRDSAAKSGRELPLVVITARSAQW
ncbi:nitroreductase/quinone reductase family protein [Mycobacterium paraseoulense]|uniref:nitroreductase/quinone reductase family protein n=1 Tax=Mycobacterium TaxID=1763 RepID=UPI0009F65181|nr:nitroreductase/quinone reductase family protein [Mycobacterium paraseoulense]